ncbi:MAG: hypothetical protein ACK493_08645 [Planctomycetota bacterium]|jgi:hypothetical protein
MNRHWRTAEERFDFQSGTWTCSIDPRHPERGAVVARKTIPETGNPQPPGSEPYSAAEAELRAEIFALPTLAAGSYQAAESFARRGDLHLNYAATKELPTSVSLCWRLHETAEWLPNLTVAESTECLLLEVVISFQTDLLDAVPVRETQVRLPRGRILPLPPLRPAQPGEIERPTSENASLLEANGSLWLSVVYPSDLRWLALSRDSQTIQQQIRLRAENLEKGVIRRLRCLFALAPASALESVRELPHRFADSRLPLSF